MVFLGFSAHSLNLTGWIHFSGRTRPGCEKAEGSYLECQATGCPGCHLRGLYTFHVFFIFYFSKKYILIVSKIFSLTDIEKEAPNIAVCL